MPRLAAKLSKVAWQQPIAATVLAVPGASLRDHLESGRLQSVLAERKFEIVVLQELGGFPLCDPTGGVRHEVLHVKRLLVDGVPRLALAEAVNWDPLSEEGLS